MIDIGKLRITAPFNAGALVHTCCANWQVVDVVKKNGGKARIKWAGFLPVEWARAIEGAVPVKIVIYGYDYDREPNYVKRGVEFLQGCYFNELVWGVIEDGKPKIVRGEKDV